MQLSSEMNGGANTRKALAIVERALNGVFSDRNGRITAATDADVQKALFLLRAEGDAKAIDKVERISALLFTAARAQRNGRPNLYASQLQRLRRLASA